MIPAAPALALSGSNAGGGAAFLVAVHDGLHVVDVGSTTAERTDLAVLVERTCTAAGIAVRSLRSLLVDCGPGSYTGLRVAVTFARTLAEFGGARLFRTSSLDLLAASALRGLPSLPAPGVRILAALDGRQERIHLGAFALDSQHVLRQLSPTRMATLHDLGSELGADDLVVAPVPLHEGLAAKVAAAGARSCPVGLMHAGLFFDPMLAVEGVTPAALDPLYLMGSYVG